MTHLSSLAIFLLALGSALRLTRLAVADTIAQPFRSALAGRYAKAFHAHAERIQQNSTYQDTERKLDTPLLDKLARKAGVWLWLVQLFECPWCIGFWISLAVAAVALSPVASTLWFTVPALGLSISYLVGTIYTAVYTLEQFEPNGHDH